MSKWVYIRSMGRIYLPPKIPLYTHIHKYNIKFEFSILFFAIFIINYTNFSKLFQHHDEIKMVDLEKCLHIVKINMCIRNVHYSAVLH